ncbi:MAG: carboxypeptidase regulatory-like domain-containing protein, partial [Chloroflexi bacterium]|nr:carboxypeptidase regulatory-like domain-containing protein [Chloroflexota bacterium]
MKANLQRTLAATLTLALIATAVVALSLSGDNGRPRPIEAGAPPPTVTPTPTNTATPTPTPTKAPEFNAVAKVIADAEDLIEGPMSRGRLGDYLLANSEIQVVIQDIERNIFSVGQFGGQILDADLVREVSDPERDNFEEWAVGINLENTGHYTKVNIINDGSNGQPAVIRVTGVDDLLDFINPSSQVAGFGLELPAGFDDVDLPVEVTTDYTLAPNDNFVQVDTTFKNTSGTLIETFITDFLSGSGEVEHFVPGYGFGEPLATSSCALCNFVAWSGYGLGEGVSYGYIHGIPDSTVFSTSGVTIPALGVSAALALIGGEETTPIEPNGGELTVTRYFAVGDGDVGSIVDIRNTILGLATGTITGTITRAGQPVEGADVVVLGDQADGPSELTTNVVSHYRTDANGQYEGTLPPGDYTLQAHLDGHLAASPDPANVTVIDSSTTTQDFTIPEAGRVRVTIVDESNAAIAGKVSLVGFDQYPDPENTGTLLGFVQIRTALFGEVSKDRLPFGLAKVVFVDNMGDSGEFFIEPGSYRVVVSHGTEYSIFEEDIVVTAGALNTVSAQIARVIDTTGFVSGDFHIHQLNSPDSAVTFEQRVVSALAEGLEFFTPSDHQFRSDLAPTIASLGVGSLVSVAPNSENTTPDYGHFNAWPVPIDPNQVNGGALDWAVEAPAGQDFPSFGNYVMPPAEIFANLLDDEGVNTVHINHMDSFFGPGGLAIDTSFIPPQDFADNAAKRLDPSIPNLFDDGFTALEVWQGTGLGDIDSFINRNLGDWFNM